MSLADLPIGKAPEVAYVVAGSSVVHGDRSIDLEWEVTAVEGDLVYNAAEGSIYWISWVGPRGIIPLTGDASSAPVDVGVPMWIEDDRRIVYAANKPSLPQPLPDGCCDGARVVGQSFDSYWVYVSSEDDAWLWDFAMGRTDGPVVRSDASEYIWRIDRLGAGLLVDTGPLSELVVEYPGDEWAWGYVEASGVPGSKEPVDYIERERLTARRVWLTNWGEVLALEPTGRLVVLGSEVARDRDGHQWRRLTGSRTALALPSDLAVTGVVTEGPHTVLVDATDDGGYRAWVRCHLRSYWCEIATELGPDDITPD
jgi:hypothetical protein